MSKESEDKLFGLLRSAGRKLSETLNSILTDCDGKDRKYDQNQRATSNAEPPTLTKSKALEFAEQLQKRFPDIVSTRISRVENEENREVHIIQTMCDSQGQTVFTASDHKDVVGREWPQGTKLSNEIIELIGKDVTCIISLPEQVLTFSEAVDYARECKAQFPQITKTQISSIHNDKTGDTHIVQNMLNENGEYIYIDEKKEEMVGRFFPVNTKLCAQLTELMEGDAKCIIDI